MENQFEQVATPVERMLEQFKVSRVFGEVIREGDTAVVPVGEVTSYFGYGYGSGEGPVPSGEDAATGKMASGPCSVKRSKARLRNGTSGNRLPMIARCS